MSKSLKKLTKTHISPVENLALRFTGAALRELFGAEEVILGGNIKVLQVGPAEFERTNGRMMRLVVDCNALRPSSIEKLERNLTASVAANMVWKCVCEVQLDKNDAGDWTTREIFVSVQPREEVDRRDFLCKTDRDLSDAVFHFPTASFTCRDEQRNADFDGLLPEMSSRL